MCYLESVEQLVLYYFPHRPTDDQLNACRAIVRFLFDSDPHATFLLRGYAGTGKTSLVSALIKVAPQLNIRTQLLAPTGRAAKVLSNYSGRKALTIHKKIYRTALAANGVMRMVRTENKHSYTLFIVDEASMIGTENSSSGRSLLDDLIDYVQDGSHCRLLLLGDGAQLPPVGLAESPALDADYLSAVYPLSVSQYEMREVVRQQHLSGILANATALRQLLQSQTPSFPSFATHGFDDVMRLNGADLEETINSLYDANDIEDTVIITRSNKRANLFNNAIRGRILFREEEINAGDMIMVVKNNYFWVDADSDMGFVANGDVAEVLSVRHREEMYGFHFVDASLRFVDYPEVPEIDCKLILETLSSESPSLTHEEAGRLYDAVMADYADLPTKAERLEELRKNPYYNALQVKFAYALTCHKTQGGQWRNVIVDQGFITDDMVDREFLRWLYTAVTRASERLYLLNFSDRFFADAAE